MADLHHLLAIYVHAHRTGNSVPPYIDAEARATLAAKPSAPARLRQCAAHGQQPANVWACPECLRELREKLPEGLSVEEYFHIDSGARIISEPSEEWSGGCWTVRNSRQVNPCTEFRTVADAVAALTPAARWEMYDGEPVQAADGEREELAQWLDWLLPAFHREHDSTHASNCLRAAALLRQPAPAPVPGWQPISTAPRDGTEILASDYDAIEIVSWNCDPSPWDSQTGDGPAWCDRDGLRMFPAWWQPLPDHPPIPTPTKPTND